MLFRPHNRKYFFQVLVFIILEPDHGHALGQIVSVRQLVAYDISVIGQINVGPKQSKIAPCSQIDGDVVIGFHDLNPFRSKGKQIDHPVVIFFNQVSCGDDRIA